VTPPQGATWVALEPGDDGIWAIRPRPAIDVTPGQPPRFLARVGDAEQAAVRVISDAAADPLTLTVDLPPPSPAHGDLEQEWARAQIAEMYRLWGLDDPSGFFTHALHSVHRRWGDGSLPSSFDRARGWARPVRTLGAYDLVSGSAAIDESLQVDTELTVDDPEKKRTIPIEGVIPLKTPAHPFTEPAEPPAVTDLAGWVPVDQLFAWFENVSDLIEGNRLAESGLIPLQQITVSAKRSTLSERIAAQLCLQVDEAARPFYETVIGETVLTTNEIDLVWGGDVTLIFEVREPIVFDATLAAFAATAMAGNPDAEMSQHSHGGYTFHGITTPDRRISRLWLRRGNIAVVSNSAPALERVLEASVDVRPSVRNDPAFLDFRKRLPRDEARREAYVFLSDPFIRRVIGPEQRIGNARRRRSAVVSRRIENAALLRHVETNEFPPDVDTLLAEDRLLPEDLRSGNAEQFTFDPEARRARSSVWGEWGRMPPLIERPVTHVSPAEQHGYDLFRTQYERYWRAFFDPIGVRVHLDEPREIELIVMPLIESTAYRALTAVTGSEPAEFDAVRIPPSAGVSFALHFQLPEEVALEIYDDIIFELPGRYAQLAEGSPDDMNPLGFPSPEDVTRLLGDQVVLHLCDHPQLVGFEGQQFLGMLIGLGGMDMMEAEFLTIVPAVMSLFQPVVIDVELGDVEVFAQLESAVMALLARIQTEMDAATGGFLEFEIEQSWLDEPDLEDVRLLSVRLMGTLTFRMFYTVRDSHLWVSSRLETLTQSLAGELWRPEGPANLALVVNPGAWRLSAAERDLTRSERAAAAARGALGALNCLRLHGVSPDDPFAAELLGHRLSHPTEGAWIWDPREGNFASTVFGSPARPTLPLALESDQPEVLIQATAVPEEDGLRSRVRFLPVSPR
jgi:hypothetical protein